MKHGPNILEANPVLEGACRALNDYLALRDDLEQDEIERELINDSLRLAADFPDAAHDIWEVMAAAVNEVNSKLRELNAPLLHFVSFETFLRLTSQPLESPHSDAAASVAVEEKGE